MFTSVFPNYYFSLRNSQFPTVFYWFSSVFIICPPFPLCLRCLAARIVNRESKSRRDTDRHMVIRIVCRKFCATKRLFVRHLEQHLCQSSNFESSNRLFAFYCDVQLFDCHCAPVLFNSRARSMILNGEITCDSWCLGVWYLQIPENLPHFW